jgi:hypothetical protein
MSFTNRSPKGRGENQAPLGALGKIKKFTFFKPKSSHQTSDTKLKLIDSSVNFMEALYMIANGNKEITQEEHKAQEKDLQNLLRKHVVNNPTTLNTLLVASVYYRLHDDNPLDFYNSSEPFKLPHATLTTIRSDLKNIVGTRRLETRDTVAPEGIGGPRDTVASKASKASVDTAFSYDWNQETRDLKQTPEPVAIKIKPGNTDGKLRILTFAEAAAAVVRGRQQKTLQEPMQK